MIYRHRVVKAGGWVDAGLALVQLVPLLRGAERTVLIDSDGEEIPLGDGPMILGKGPCVAVPDGHYAIESVCDGDWEARTALRPRLVPLRLSIEACCDTTATVYLADAGLEPLSLPLLAGARVELVGVVATYVAGEHLEVVWR